MRQSFNFTFFKKGDTLKGSDIYKIYEGIRASKNILQSRYDLIRIIHGDT